MRVVIIGAGAAGLAVAKGLREQGGFEITHLEAQPQIGGRVSSVTLGGEVIDSGASFIHHKQQSLYPQAKQRDLLAATGKSGMLFQGRYLAPWRFALFHILPSLQKAKRLIQAFYRNDDAKKTLAQLVDEQQMNPATRNYFYQLLSVALAAPLEKIAALPLRDSFKSAGMRPEQELINQWLKRPMAELLAEIYQQEIDQVLVNHPVTAIDYSQPEIRVSCANGAEFFAERVVVTVPLGVLKQSRIQFNPPLPQSHQQAIANLGMGQGGKLLLRFSKRFWKRGLQQLLNIDGPCQFWLPNPQQPVLVAFYIGEADLPQILKALGNAFKCDAATLLEESIHQDWSANPYIGGLYSYDGLGSQGARSTLQQPIAERLYFAGEATTEGHFATVDGAILSGERVVSALLER